MKSVLPEKVVDFVTNCHVAVVLACTTQRLKTVPVIIVESVQKAQIVDKKKLIKMDYHYKKLYHYLVGGVLV